MKRAKIEETVQTEDVTIGDVAYPSASNYVNRSELDWFADSAATRHMTYHRSSLRNFKPIRSGDRTVTGINNTEVETHYKGDPIINPQKLFF